MQGIVVSTKMDKAVIVLVQSRKRHKKYNKSYKVKKKYPARANFPLQVGQSVLLKSTRPLSKTIRWEAIPIETK